MSSSRVMVLVPAFNEAERIGAVVRGVARVLPDAEIVVVDDGSRDDTTLEATRAGARVLDLPFNLGYGGALQTGYRYALENRTDVIVQMDADGQHDPAQIPALLETLEREGADLVIGSRFLAPSGYTMGATRTVGRKLFQRLARVAGLEVTDPTSGFQAIRRSVFSIYVDPFFPTDYPDVDVLLVVHRAGHRIVEVPVVMHQTTRPSTLHGGLRSIFYVYRLGLSVWGGAGKAR
ncbi:MAG: glycosyltransferase family 2 protein [Planctomycetota bacterium]